ncbi:hypothetical protein SAMN04488028_101977 [Reichenbachiella agariperforans]|uniref:Uncharacterized protein n=1 Tax=Reichenbachiella agariperforans TaxID=156994 RepID=A0A1M6LIR1_REIAG|nr:HEPN domain-containing protein [Reichenbachiella agariperforans]SHJ71076.1 hypothetical protein SAMN04488028_101977 [Reichenbachiella agariperforans]
MKFNKAYKGEFLIPGEEKNIVFGVLKFLNGTAYIDLFGHFHTKQDYKPNVKLIYGHLDNGESCIFFNCKLKPPHPIHRTDFINFEYFIYAPTHILTGDPENKIEFNALNFRMDYLTVWTGINVFESFYEGEKVAGVKRITKDIDDLILFKNEDFELRVTHVHSVPLINPYAEYKLEQESWLYSDMKTHLTFSEVFTFLKEIEDIFVLLIGTDVRITTPITIYSTDEKSYYCYRNGRNLRIDPITHSEDNPSFHEPLINLNSLKEQTELTNFFECWQTIRVSHEYSIDKIVQALRCENSNPEGTFLDLVFALEKMIEKDMPSSVIARELTPKDLKHISILEGNGIEKNTIDYLKTRIKKINASSLKDKILKFLEKNRTHIEKVIAIEYELFINKLVDSRNNLAHLCKNCEYQMTPSEFPNFNKQLLMLLLILTFDKMNIKPDYMATILKRNSKFHLKEY